MVYVILGFGSSLFRPNGFDNCPSAMGQFYIGIMFVVCCLSLCLLTMADVSNQSKAHLIFAYGTLKRGFPNHTLMQSLIHQNDAVFLGPFVTCISYPLVVGPHGIPFLINLPGLGNRVTGELYSVSARGLSLVDDLEGTSLGHYERLPVKLIPCESTNSDAGGVIQVEAEAYYAHRSFGEGLWERKGREGLSAYTEKEASGYVRREDRPKDRSFRDEVHFFVSAAKN